ncbi:hypothetical protein [uncultured Alsobacter sp.]|uniref:hypothetical protein n=1 Tax=uncultured Alsobacter sp. TaxID=1748258 RepID=UPI0025CF3449|nr:hypothetical protein [uncultured Alsobacter sp.]
MNHNPTVDLIEALGRGIAEPADVAAMLRSRGIDSLEDLFAALREARGPEAPDEAHVPLSLTRERPSARGLAAKRPLKPRLPVLMNGTLYDPTDFASRQVRPLHLVWAGWQQFVAIDNDDVIQTWWRVNWLDSLNRALAPYEDDPSVSKPYKPGTGAPPPAPPAGQKPPPPPSPDPGWTFDLKQAQFFEHENLTGRNLPLERNRGFYDLTKARRGVLQDWNDAISSLYMPSGVCVLHEHIHWSGQTLTLNIPPQAGWRAERDLRQMAHLTTADWNDRASSIEFW